LYVGGTVGGKEEELLDEEDLGGAINSSRMIKRGALPAFKNANNEDFRMSVCACVLRNRNV
jgi:hypothetical protein